MSPTAGERIRDRARRLLETVGPGAAIALAGVALIGLLTGPVLDEAIRFPDTRSYLRWPAPMLMRGVEIMGARAPAYPALLSLLGTGSTLVLWQWWVSLGAWAYLGWRLARVPGAFAGACLALAPALAAWNLAALTESLSGSLAALLVALGLSLSRVPRPIPMAVWCVSLAVFGLLRDVNLVTIPFLCIPLLALPRRPAAILAVIAGLVMLVASVDMTRNGRGRINTYQAIWWRVQPDPEARAFFVDAGMPPAPMRLDDPQSLADSYAWLAEGGVWTYRRWVMGQTRYYGETWARLGQGDASAALRDEYFGDRAVPPGGALARMGAFVYSATAPPRLVWLTVLLGVPLLDWRRNRQIGATTAFATGLGVATVVHAFVAYVSDFAEIDRHLLGAYQLYRMAFCVGLLALVEAMRSGEGRALIPFVSARGSQAAVGPRADPVRGSSASDRADRTADPA